MTISASSQVHSVQWRMYIGPPWRRDDATDFYDWTGLGVTTGDPTPAATTLASNLAAGATSAVLTSAASFPTKGAFWVAGNAAGEAWEHITYSGKSTNTLTGLTRETISVEQTGVHTAGAVVKLWWAVDLAEGPEYVGEMDQNLASTFWRANVQGVNFPQAAMRNGNLAILQARWTEGTSWGNWTTELVGWLLDPHMRDDTTRERRWNAQVVSSRQMLDLVEITGIRVGAVNAAAEGAASVSSSCDAPYKLANLGEFTVAEPNLSGDSAIDGDMETLWVSEWLMGTTNYGLWGIDQIHINPYPGQSTGFRWIQIGAHGRPHDIILRNNLNEYPEINEDFEPPYSDNDFKAIICENAAAFRSENATLADGVSVIEISDNTCSLASPHSPGRTISDWWDSLAPASGILGYFTTLLGFQGGVEWGTGDASGWGWTGPAVAAPAAGQTIKRLWSGNGLTAAGWTVGVSTPGYYTDTIRQEYLALTLRSMGLTVRDDITAVAPGTGETLYITSALGDSVDGLDASGTVQIGSEQITYSAKTAANDGLVVTARGANSTTAAAHSTGDLIYAMQDGVAVDAYPITQIKLRRPSGVPYPVFFWLRGTTFTVARPPPRFWTINPFTGLPNTDYQDDWTVLAAETTNALAEYTLTISPAKRYRQILFECRKMSTDPYWIALNEIEVLTDTAVFDSTRNLTGADAADVMAAALKLAGFPDAAITDNADTPSVDGFTTDVGGAGAVAADVADYTGCRYDTGRDSLVTLRLDPYWSSGSLPAEAINWTNLLATYVEPDWRNGQNVGQVELEWKDAAGDEQDKIRYPTTASPIGARIAIGPYVYANSTAALAGATKRYWQARRPYGILFEAAGAPWDIDAGDAAGVQWTLADGMNALDRTYMTQTVTHDSKAGGLTSVFQVLQISGQDET